MQITTSRGYYVVYRENEKNLCPGCGHSHWHIGRVSAECGFCSTAIPLAGAGFGREASPNLDAA